MDDIIAHRLEPFRTYLKFLAHANIGQQMLAKLDSSDIAQQTLVRACVGIPQDIGNDQIRIRAWLRKVLANVLADEVRRFTSRKRDAALEVSIHKRIEEAASVLEIGLVAGGASPSVQVENKETYERIERALSDLPPPMREVVTLRHHAGMTVEQIAKRMDKSTAAVAGLLRRGLQKLRESLGPRD